MIDALSIDLSAEMDFVASVTRDHIKTYQAWYIGTRNSSSSSSSSRSSSSRSSSRSSSSSSK